jgi:hypothetical protein
MPGLAFRRHKARDAADAFYVTNRGATKLHDQT